MTYPTTDELRELSQDQRLQLIGDVWETLSQSGDPMPLHPGHGEELDLRLKVWARDGDNGDAWPDVRARILRRA